MHDYVAYVGLGIGINLKLFHGGAFYRYSDWVWGGAATLGMTYFVDRSWFVEFGKALRKEMPLQRARQFSD